MAWNKYYIMISNQKQPITKKQLEDLDQYIKTEIEKIWKKEEAACERQFIYS